MKYQAAMIGVILCCFSLTEGLHAEGYHLRTNVNRHYYSQVFGDTVHPAVDKPSVSRHELPLRSPGDEGYRELQAMAAQFIYKPSPELTSRTLTVKDLPVKPEIRPEISSPIIEESEPVRSANTINYGQIPSPVYHQYPPPSHSGFVLERRKTPDAITYTAFPARLRENYPQRIYADPWNIMGYPVSEGPVRLGPASEVENGYMVENK